MSTVNITALEVALRRILLSNALSLKTHNHKSCLRSGSIGRTSAQQFLAVVGGYAYYVQSAHAVVEDENRTLEELGEGY